MLVTASGQLLASGHNKYIHVYDMFILCCVVKLRSCMIVHVYLQNYIASYPGSNYVGHEATAEQEIFIILYNFSFYVSSLQKYIIYNLTIN